MQPARPCSIAIQPYHRAGWHRDPHDLPKPGACIAVASRKVVTACERTVGARAIAVTAGQSASPVLRHAHLRNATSI
eukprot:6172387-Pleurochrysis_carterae.AAC.2